MMHTIQMHVWYMQCDWTCIVYTCECKAMTIMMEQYMCIGYKRDQPLPPSRFADPVTEEEIIEHRQSAVPKKTNEDTKYCTKVWKNWCKERHQHYQCQIPPFEDITNHQLQQWLIRFVLEVRKKEARDSDAYLQWNCSSPS